MNEKFESPSAENWFLSLHNVENIKPVCEDLKKADSSLTSLYLLKFQDDNNSELDRLALSSILDALKENKSLKRLYLENIAGEELNLFLEAIIENENINSLVISHCSLSEKNTQVLTELLKINSKIKLFGLTNNGPLDDVNFFNILAALIENKNITNLDFSWLELRHRGESLVELLNANSTIETLNLTSTMITDNDARLIATALEKNTPLKKLNLQLNSLLSGEGIKTIARTLSTNSSLTELNLSKMPIGEAEAEVILDALKTNYTLRKLKLNGLAVTLSQESYNKIETKLNENKEIFEESRFRNTKVAFSIYSGGKRKREQVLTEEEPESKKSMLN